MDPRGIRMSAPWRERAKHAIPQIVHLARFGRLMANQVRYPIVGTCLDWGGTIIGGPFRGIRYPRSGIGNYFEVIGTYEQCLIPLVEQIIRRQPKVIIDVGACYGYYALGFAKRCPATRVVAYELDATRQDLIRKYARWNNLERRVELRGECTTADLDADLPDGRGALVFMDVEGAEDALLRPDEAPGLRRAEIVVELHEMFVPGVTERLSDRFAETHRGTLIRQTPSELTEELDAPATVNRLLRSYWSRMTTEDRASEMAWLHLVPRAPA
jgi:hypothetical protein